VNYGYDAYRNMTSTTDANGRVEQRVYDRMDRMVQVLHPQVDLALGGQAQKLDRLVDLYEYDGLGQRIGHSYKSNVSTVNLATARETTDYDAQGRVTRTIDFEGGQTTYGYNWAAAHGSPLGTKGALTRITTSTAGLTASETSD